MPEIDMIPRSYHDAMRLQRTLAAYATAAALLLVFALLLGAGLRWRIASQGLQVSALRSSIEQSEQARRQLALAQSRQISLTQQLAALTALRGAGEIGRMTNAIDAALGQHVWFTTLDYARDAQVIGAGQKMPVQSGYLLVLPPDAPGQSAASANRSWRLSNNIEIKGSATDHAALTDFLQALSAQSAIADVHFVNSGSPAANLQQQVDFNVMAATRTSTGSAP